MHFLRNGCLFLFALHITASSAFSDGGIKGVLAGDDGFPIVGVIVRIIDTTRMFYYDTETRRMYVDELNVTIAVGRDGSYSYRLPAATYSVSIFSDSLCILHRTVTVIDGCYTDVSIGHLLGPGSISGCVTDDRGSPVADAYIQVAETELSTQTDSSGHYVIADLQPGTYSLTASAYSMVETECDSIQVHYDLETECNFDVLSGRGLQPATGCITGRVDNAFGEPIVCGAVMIRGTAMGSLTDSLGIYQINYVEPGTYTLLASVIGYGRTNSPSIKVFPGNTSVFHFTSHETNGNEIKYSDWALQPEYGSETRIE